MRNINNSSKSSEVHAYVHIYNELIKKKGWNTLQIFTQQESHNIPEIKSTLGLLKPENIVKISERSFYIIEAKNERRKLDTALSEAREYAVIMNDKSKDILCKFITGIAGNDKEGFIAKSEYLDSGGKWNVITENNAEITGLLSKNQITEITTRSNAQLTDIEISDTEFIESAEEINSILHDNSIHKDYRARFISTILLALSDGSEINLDEDNTSVLISTINAKSDAILNRHGKKDFTKFVKIDEPSSSDNHVKVKAAIILTIQELLSLNIRSAMRSGRDVLGEFYEIFLKYGNGAKDIGIVLTPRHITRFAAEVLDIKPNDLVLDPTCGTGGFLVAAFDEARKKMKNEADLDNFKRNGLYGIEEQDPVISLAIVNMIFRGDGKSNMIEGNCFNKWLTLQSLDKEIRAKYIDHEDKDRIPPITKVLMNPPFAQKASKNKEYHFINHALDQMQQDGLLFAVLPTSVLIERSTKQWRKDLLKSNTLISVTVFPPDLFYPTGTHTLGMIVRKGIPHDQKSKVLWVKASHDGYLKRKGRRIKHINESNELEVIKDELKILIQDSSYLIEDIPEFKKLAPIDFNSEEFELVPEYYLDDKQPTLDDIKSEISKLIKVSAGYLLTQVEKEINIKVKNTSKVNYHNIKYFRLTDLYSVERSYAPYMNELDGDIGITPYVTTTELNNGISLRCEIAPNFTKNTLTVSLDGTCGTTFYQFEDFISGEKTAVLVPKSYLEPELLFYVGAIIRLKSWRYHYGRKLSMTRLQHFTIPLPVDNHGNIDINVIKEIVSNSYGWEIVEAHIN